MKRYYDLLEAAESAGDYCWTTWFSNFYYLYDLGLFADTWDEMLEELALAEREADSAHQVDLIRRVRAASLYSGSFLLYFRTYELGDEAALDVLRARWDEMFETLGTCGITKLLSTANYENLINYGELHSSLDETMWTEFARDRELVVYKIMGLQTMRPAPEEYANAD